MGCNTSQELKTKDGAALDAVSNGEPEPSAPQLELAGDSAKSSNNHTNHAKSNSIISNGDAKSAASAKSGATGAGAAATNGIERSCDKAKDSTEFNDDVEDEGKCLCEEIYEKFMFIHVPTRHCVCVSRYVCVCVFYYLLCLYLSTVCPLPHSNPALPCPAHTLIQ